MLKSKYFYLILLVIISSIISLKIRSENNNQVSVRLKQEQVSVIDTLLFESGDIILRQGTSFVSSFIARSFPGSHGMSHCGILVEDNGVWKVIHSISGQISECDGIRIENANSFIKNASENQVVLVKPKFIIDKSEITANAWTYLKRKTTFDHDFNLNDTSKLYCSELVRAVYLDAGADDVFTYKNITGKRIIDLTSFFNKRYWEASF